MIYHEGKAYYSEEDVRDIVKGTVDSLSKVIEEKDKTKLTKEQILSISNTEERQKAISENLELFR